MGKRATPNQAAKRLFLAGVTLYANGQYNEALLSYQQAAQLNPLLPHLSRHVGHTYMAMGLYRLAIQAFTSSLEENKEKEFACNTYKNLGYCYMELEEYELALPWFRQAELLDYEDPHLHNCLGGTYMLMGDDDLAIAEYEQTLLLDQGNCDALNNLACIYIYKRQYKKALGYCRASLKLEPKNPISLNTLVTLYAELGWEFRKKQALARLFKYAPGWPIFQPLSCRII